MARTAPLRRSGAGASKTATGGGVSAERLRSFVERIERLEEEKAAIAGDIRDVYAEAKADGFDTKIMRQVIRLRTMDAADAQEQEELLEVYKRALGMLADTPLGESAMRRARAGNVVAAVADGVVAAGESAPAGAHTVTLTVPGMAPVHTTIEGMRRAADRLGGRRERAR